MSRAVPPLLDRPLPSQRPFDVVGVGVAVLDDLFLLPHFPVPSRGLALPRVPAPTRG